MKKYSFILFNSDNSIQVIEIYAYTEKEMRELFKIKLYKQYKDNDIFPISWKKI